MPQRRYTDPVGHLPKGKLLIHFLQPFGVPLTSALLAAALTMLGALGFGWGKTPASQFASLRVGQEQLVKTVARIDSVHMFLIAAVDTSFRQYVELAQPVIDAQAIDLCQRLDLRTRAMIPALDCRSRLAR